MVLTHTPTTAAAVTGSTTLRPLPQAEINAWAYIQGRRDGTIRSLRTPWEKYNAAHLDGIEIQNIITIAGMSSTGKSAISGQLERDLFPLNPNEDFLILSFNFEMPSTRIVLRNLVAEMGINMRTMLSADGVALNDVDYERLRSRIEDRREHYPIYYVEYPKTVAQYKAICRSMHAAHPRKNIITISDHSILFKQASGEKDATSMLYSLGEASMELKKELPITQIHLSQLNREIEKPERRLKWSPLNYPAKDCLFGGDALYQCADTVLVNHRPSILNYPMNGYGPDKLPTGPNDLYWHFLKIREGSPHMATMTADFENMKIYDGNY